jgi:hypothetical protein
MRIVILAYSLLGLFTFGFGDATAGILDSASISQFYKGGDFDKAVPILDSLLKSKRVRTHRDSVFAFKYLGVMYLANDKSRELGKYYILQLLLLEPGERLLDMYPSDKIYAIFKIVLDEFTAAQSKLNPQSGFLATAPEAPKESELAPPPKKSVAKKWPKRRTYYWVGAVSVMAVIGVATYLISRNRPDKKVALVVD